MFNEEKMGEGLVKDSNQHVTILHRSKVSEGETNEESFQAFN